MQAIKPRVFPIVYGPTNRLRKKSAAGKKATAQGANARFGEVAQRMLKHLRPD